jgi:hypothetical protein
MMIDSKIEMTEGIFDFVHISSKIQSFIRRNDRTGALEYLSKTIGFQKHYQIFSHIKAIKQIEEYVLEVEKECPVAKQFGFSGVGEGIVWKSNCGLQFKTKGEEHKVSRTKELVPIDEEKLNSIGEFINYAVTEARLNQGIEYVFTQNALEPSIEKVGDFLRWVQNDILKEELNALDSNGLTIKDVNPLISKTTVTWFKQRF